MSKPMLVTLPFVLLLIDYWPLRRLVISRTGKVSSCIEKTTNYKAYGFGLLVLEKLPLFCLTAISIALTLSAQKHDIAVMEFLPLQLRISNALVSYCDYLAKAVWPVPLAILYPYPESIPSWEVIGAASFLIAVTALAVCTIRRHPYFLFGWLWYIGTLVPVIGIIQVGVQSMADRYIYIPFIGIFISAVWLACDLTYRLKYRQYIVPALSAIILAALFIATWIQLDHWRNSKAVFTHALSVTSNNYVMHTNMGTLLSTQGNIEESIIHYKEALRIHPADFEANFNLANLFLRQGKVNDAIDYYREAVRSKPDFAQVYNNLGIACSQLGNEDKALEQFREAVGSTLDTKEP